MILQHENTKLLCALNHKVLGPQLDFGSSPGNNNRTETNVVPILMNKQDSGQSPQSALAQASSSRGPMGDIPAKIREIRITDVLLTRDIMFRR